MRRRPFLLIFAIVALLTLLSHANHPNSHARAQAKRRRTEQPDPSKIKKYVSAQESQEIGEAFSRAGNAFEKQDYKTGAENLKTAYLLNPEDDLIIDFLAESNVMVPDRSASLMWLQRLLTVSPCFFHMPENAASVLTPQEYAELARTAKAKGPVLHASRIAFRLSETDLIPEGIAYDPLDQAFFLSSLHKRKIVRVRLRARGAPLVEDFAAPAQDGLYSTLGMKVDAERRILWVCSSAESFMQGYADADSGKAALFKYDLNTRKLIAKYELGPKPAHLLNDVVLNAEGDVFVTDTVSGDIFTVNHDRDQLEVFIPAGTFHSPNGIAISDDGRQLFISEMPLGVYAVDLKTKRSERLPQSVGISPAGSDGLYFYNGSLIGIINIVSERNGRVARFYLDGPARSISHARVLDCNHPLYQWPTTGVVVGDSLFYIANSQFGSFNSEKRTFPRESLHQVAVMKVKL